MNLQSILRDIREIADRYADVDDGQPNDWMRVKVLAESGIKPSESTEPEFPHPLNCIAFKRMWESWLQYRRERKLPNYKPTGRAAQLKRLSQMGAYPAIKAIEYSICQNYQGIYEERQGSAKQNPRVTQTLNAPGRYAGAADILARKRAEISQGVQPGLTGPSGNAGGDSEVYG